LVLTRGYCFRRKHFEMAIPPLKLYGALEEFECGKYFAFSEAR